MGWSSGLCLANTLAAHLIRFSQATASYSVPMISVALVGLPPFHSEITHRTMRAARLVASSDEVEPSSHS